MRFLMSSFFIMAVSLPMTAYSQVGSTGPKTGSLISCNDWRGQVIEISSAGVAKVKYPSQTRNGVKKDEWIEEQTIAHCKEFTPVDELKIDGKKFSLDGSLSCNDWRGEVTELYSDGFARVKYPAQSRHGVEKPETYEEHYISHCNPFRRVVSLKLDGKQFAVGGQLSCNEWRGRIAELASDGFAVVDYAAQTRHGVSKPKTREEHTIGHCVPFSAVDSLKLEGKEFVVGSKVSCNEWNGEILKLFSDGFANVKYPAQTKFGVSKDQTVEEQYISHCKLDAAGYDALMGALLNLNGSRNLSSSSTTLNQTKAAPAGQVNGSSATVQTTSSAAAL